jgi:SSS family solute:Na+ symporter
MYRALWSVSVTFIVIFVVSMFGKARPEAELQNLVYGATVIPKEEPVPFYKNEWYWAAVAIVAFLGLQIMFW